MKNYSAAALCLLLMSCSTLKTTKAKDPDRELVKAAQVGSAENSANASREPASTAASKPPLKANQVIDPAFLRAQADYHFALADSYSLNGDIDRAIEEYKLTLIYDSESPTLRYKLANEYIKKGMLSRAVEQAETAIKLKTDYWDAYLLLGTLYTSFKLYDKALDQYRQVLKSDPDNLEAGLYIGALLAEQKKYPESVAHFKKLATASGGKQTHLAWYYLARVYNEQGKKKEAEQTFVKAVDVKPDFLEGVMGLAAFYETEKQEQKALKVYKSYQEKYGPSAKVAGALGRIYLENEDYDLAYKQFEVLEGLDSDNLNNKVKMSLILIEQKKFDKAIRKLKEILAVAPDSEKIRFYLAAVYEETKVYKEAIEQFQYIQADSSLYQEAVIHTAYLFKLLGEMENSSKTMEVAVTKRPDVPQFYSFYSSILDDQKQVSKAIAILEKGVAKFPQDEQMYFYLGSMQDKAGNKEKTITNMRKVISLNAEHVQALNYLGYTMADLNKDLDEAEQFVRRALKLKPDDAYITDSLGWVLFKQGKVKESVATLERAFQMKPTESIIAEHLGDAYFKYALKNKARQMYQRAVSLETNEENLAKLKQKLSNLDVDDNRRPASVENR